jgi:hypothetical protein
MPLVMRNIVDTYVRDSNRRALVASVALSLALMSSAAMAQERVGDAALGALSGAVVLGPIGAVAGAVVGFTAGPSIARSWGMGGSSQARPPRRPASPAPHATVSDSRQPTPESQRYTPTTVAPPPVPKSASAALPPVQPIE